MEPPRLRDLVGLAALVVAVLVIFSLSDAFNWLKRRM